MSEANPTGPTGQDLVLGGRTVLAKYRDGSQEEVKVQSLPMKMMERWSTLRGDEASIVELVCGKLDLPALFKMNNLAAHERALIGLLSKEEEISQITKLRAQLTDVQEEILQLEAAGRWDDKLTPESHDEIYDVGKRINHPRFERWRENLRESAAQVREEIKEMRNLAESPSASSASSPASSSAPAEAARS